jgi:hypothetical protein
MKMMVRMAAVLAAIGFLRLAPNNAKALVAMRLFFKATETEACFGGPTCPPAGAMARFL